MTKNEENNKKKKKTKFSPLRILIGLVVGMILIFGFLEIDAYLVTMPYYRDLIPNWTHDGKKIVFARWLPVAKGFRDPFQVWQMNADGSNQKMIYESVDGYNTYGIRRFKVASDDSYVYMRLNRKYYSDGKLVHLKDKLARAPLKEGGKVQEWELKKDEPFDVFLAFFNNRVLLRRMKQGGKNRRNVLYEYRFSDRKKLREIKLDKKQICVIADYFGPDNRLFGVVEDVKFSKKAVLYEMTGELKKIFNCPKPGIKYLPKRKVFVEFAPPGKGTVIVRNIEGKTVKVISNPLGPDCYNYMAYPDNESYIALLKGQRMCFINLDDCSASFLDMPLKATGRFTPNPDGKKIAFSNSKSVFIIDRDGKNLKQLTDTSPREKMLRKSWYKKYMNWLKKFLYGEGGHGGHGSH